MTDQDRIYNERTGHDFIDPVRPYGYNLGQSATEKWLRWLSQSWQAPKPHWSLAPLGAVYGYGAALRRRWHRHFGRPALASVPVVGVGNLTVGGSGKTPLCLALAQMFLDRDYHPAVLSRGYGRCQTSGGDRPLVVSQGQGPEVDHLASGDEPWLMAHSLPGLRVVVAADRVRGAKVAVEDLGADVLILDDGFQQLKLAVDCQILLIPARTPFGNGAVLPAGPLREPLSAHRLADILVSTGSPTLTSKVLELAGGRPVFAADHRPLGWRRLGAGPLEPAKLEPLGALTGCRVLAFCGLGRPDGFERTLGRLGVDIRRFVALRDHQPYDLATLQALGLAFMASGAEVMVTTAKDAVKLPPDFPLPVLALHLETTVSQADEFWGTVLRIVKH